MNTITLVLGYCFLFLFPFLGSMVVEDSSWSQICRAAGLRIFIQTCSRRRESMEKDLHPFSMHDNFWAQ